MSNGIFIFAQINMKHLSYKEHSCKNNYVTIFKLFYFISFGGHLFSRVNPSRCYFGRGHYGEIIL